VHALTVSNVNPNPNFTPRLLIDSASSHAVPGAADYTKFLVGRDGQVLGRYKPAGERRALTVSPVVQDQD
jgi:glutathione peroxidase-family protein